MRLERRLAETRGRRGETAAALWLMLKGYQVLARRVRTPVGEIDLIARKGGVVAFVEVKARRSLDDAAHAVTPGAQTRIVRAAETWAKSHGWAQSAEWRFDLVAVLPGRLPIHVRDAWRPNAPR
jgi:putative endonuclease